jgi:AcrR family transcriptional regulator
MRDLAEEADVTKGAVMYHARYKQRLLEEIHRTTFESSMAALMAADPGPEANAVDRIHQLLVAHLDSLAPNRDAIAVVNDNMRYLEPDAFQRVAALRASWLDIFRGAIDYGIAQHQLRDLDAGLLTRTLVGMLNSTARWYNPRGQLRPESIAEIYTKLFMFGLCLNSG